MSRCVSYADDSVYVEYASLHRHRFYCPECGETFNKPDSMVFDDRCDCPDVCPHCHKVGFLEQGTSEEWEESICHFQRQIVAAFPSLTVCDKWLGREDHALLENRFAYFGLSRYGILVSMWVAPKRISCGNRVEFERLRDHWMASIGPKFKETALSCFGQALDLGGQFWNGETIFRFAGSKSSYGYSSKEGWL